MKNSSKKKVAGVALALGLIIPQAAPAITYADVVNSDVVKLRILETTDIHTNIVNYDYYKDAQTNEFGLSKTATLIEAARKEEKNTLLFDNGDLIQGSPLGDYAGRIKPTKEGEVHPAIKALNLLKYDAATVGNHEFNYGLDLLDESYDDAEFDLVNANVYHDDKDNNPDNDKNYFTPYKIMDKQVTDEDGETHTIKVGVIGFVPPQIMTWDKANLEGKVIVKDIVKSAETFVPKMKADGADIIVVLSHSGIDTAANEGNEENASYYLTKVEGIDAVLTGHQHKKFPAAAGVKADFADGNGFDNAKGTINGVPVTMPGSWGDNLGVIDLTVEKKDGKWDVTDSAATLRAIADKDKKPLVESSKAVEDAIKDEHQGTLEYVRGPVGETTAAINSYFALVQDDPSVQIVTNAQKWYVENALKDTKYKDLPILSAGAPFKAGGRNGSSYYTDIAPGEIAVKNVSDLYLYPNTVHAVKVNGSDLKEWLEWSAGQFKQIDPKKTEAQELVNGDFPTYNFDIIDGVTYEIDVTEPAKYDSSQNVANANANRIKNLKFNGKPVTSNMEFIVATNNYRASGVKLPSKEIVLAAPDENRQAIIDYIAQTKTINPTADKNWSFAPIKGANGVKVSFQSSPNAQKYLSKDGSIKYLSTLDTGFAEYELTIPAMKDEKPETKPETPNPASKVFWDGLLMKKGQIGKVTIEKPINLWKREGDKLVFVRILKPGEQYRVYRYDNKYGGQYGLGADHYVTNMKGYVKYQTPSKAKLKALNGQ
ncbi:MULTISPECIES: bifunctional 2',3'-cyclic-nucleotide 2'-phosphodiesterase/3'-nucleotidase [Bacillus]|uniref:Bifunctional 2',3'-cyclic-nucleotide 2'-phosphodiesterase/3'-nucleotidase n=1 Tax=Bacillus infantis TaxID=324767 RepID=A0A5D4SJV3_9BACI|nr:MULTISPECIES: bifunctional 2',3'-cyclic-nucleotide 2'-phosphodiesterase/3'-nucleotidase [Bacillus]PLR73665.1 bifunctional 2',3'-cyclic-nucleotide 2'-phosphodiesterase/3'-nucleotidase [Bacillus sp. UMB0728]TYS63807.1 bifunctional 2',3'-cyclic-nucleotide 2'-phosphodiesterase/3'-nucleotidase [Bacillus infantis]